MRVVFKKWLVFSAVSRLVSLAKPLITFNKADALKMDRKSDLIRI